MNCAFKKLNRELIKRGILTTDDYCDRYNTVIKLEGIYSWGFTTVTYCDVMPPVVGFYDNDYQFILSLDVDDAEYSLIDGRLNVKQHMGFANHWKKYSVNLNNGAPIHLVDIAGVYIKGELFDSSRILVLNNGDAYIKNDGEGLLKTKKSLVDYSEYSLIDKDAWKANVDLFNELIVTNA